MHSKSVALRSFRIIEYIDDRRNIREDCAFVVILPMNPNMAAMHLEGSISQYAFTPGVLQERVRPNEKSFHYFQSYYRDSSHSESTVLKGLMHECIVDLLRRQGCCREGGSFKLYAETDISKGKSIAEKHGLEKTKGRSAEGRTFFVLDSENGDHKHVAALRKACERKGQVAHFEDSDPPDDIQVSGPRQEKTSLLNRFIGSAIILLAAAVAVAPQLVRGPSCGHDFDFHLVSWLDANASWRQGIPYPHWTPSANFGAGEPRFVFYPPLTWMLGAALGFILPWTLVPAALNFLLLAGTGLAARALARQLLPEGAATLAGCAAIFSGYTIFCAYERSAFGELAGGVWMPLILLFALKGFRDSGSVQNTGKSVLSHPSLEKSEGWGTQILRALTGTAPLAIAVAGAWLSNAPVGVMASYLLAAVALGTTLLSRSWLPLLRAAAGAALGLGLSAVYLLPAAWEQRWVAISQAVDDPGERIENSFLFAHHADPALAMHDIELHKVSVIGAAMIALALSGIIVGWLRARNRNAGPSTPLRSAQDDNLSRRSGTWWILLALIPLAILFLQLPISLPVWNLLPKLRFLQFPWRWLVALGAPMGIFLAAAVWPGESTRRWARVAVGAACVVVFVAMTALGGGRYYQPCDEEDNVTAMAAVDRSGTGFAGTSEYAPTGADATMIATHLLGACFVDDPTTELGVAAADQPDAIPDWQPSQNSCSATFPFGPLQATNHSEHFEAKAITDRAGFLILKLTRFPAWRITVNGHAVSALPQRADGLIAVPVPEGAVAVTADWTTTPDVLAGRWLSLFSVLTVTGLWLLERRRKRPQLSS